MRKSLIGVLIATLILVLETSVWANIIVIPFTSINPFTLMPIVVTFNEKNRELYVKVRTTVVGFGGIIYPFMINSATLKEGCFIGSRSTLRAKHLRFIEGIVRGNEITFLGVSSSKDHISGSKCGGMIGLKMSDNNQVIIDPTDCWMNSVDVGFLDGDDAMPIFIW